MVMKTGLSIHFLELGVLDFQLLQSLQLRGVHTSVFALPIVKGCLVDAILSADFRNASASLLIFEDLDDLTLDKS